MEAAKTRHFPAREVQKAATRAIILSGAKALFERVGFASLTIRDLAAAAGVSTGAVFNNWSGKNDLFAECFPDDARRRLVAEGICIGLHGPHAWESATRAHRDLLLAAADRDLDSRALLQKVA